MCIEYNECHYGGMYNVYVKKRIFVITEIVYMNEKTGIDVSSEKEKVKESQSQSRSMTPPLDTHFECRAGGVTTPTCGHLKLPYAIMTDADWCIPPSGTFLQSHTPS